MNQKIRFGKSVEGRELIIHEVKGLGAASFKSIVVFGGFHGDEPKSVSMVEQLIAELNARHERNAETPKRRNAEMLKRRSAETIAKSKDQRSKIEVTSPDHPIATSPHQKINRQSAIRWVLMPIVNPDGCERRRRRNARKVDINRNFPTKNWEVGNPRSRMFGGFEPGSEPETRAVMRVIEKYRPDAIVTIHSINRNRFCNNFDGPGRALAKRMSRYNEYPVTSTIGYPTPGSFGTWAGVERGIPTITLELPSHRSAKRCWEDNREALFSLGI